MRIKQVKLENFRSYKSETVVNINDLNVVVGKNDIGKSSVLEALDVFFNEGKGVIKLDKDDINKQGVSEGNNTIKISVIFDQFPSSLSIDTSNLTSLENEYLLLENGTLEVIKKYSNAGKEKVFIKALHPTNENCADLLLQKQAGLKQKLKKFDIECSDQTRNAEIRKAIWNHFSDDLQLEEIEIELTKEDAKNIWEQLKPHMPLYSLFQSDRKNSDGDSEVQDPMKLAVQEILKDSTLREALDGVAVKVEEKLRDVSSKTLEKLNEMNPDIADGLTPVIPSSQSLKWADVFKSVSISDSTDIPINKRGSGVKRLVLLNFFRAEAERKLQENSAPSVIYSIEEPETSQHPHHQRKLIQAFKDLSNAENVQVILTTHSPSIVKMLDFECIRLIKEQEGKEVISVEPAELPYPSLNEINYLAFGEADEEYHNELYGYMESEGWFEEFKEGKPTQDYARLLRNGNTRQEQKILSEYIRHQIHHPENEMNDRFTDSQLQGSINSMRLFVQNKNSQT